MHDALVEGDEEEEEDGDTNATPVDEATCALLVGDALAVELEDEGTNATPVDDKEGNVCGLLALMQYRV